MTDAAGDRDGYARRRVLVALGTMAAEAGMLDLGAHLAVSRGLALAALLVEDVRLVQLAELPFAAEVDRVSAVRRPLDPIRRARQLRARERLLGTSLKRISELRRVATSLSVVHGELWRSALTAAGSGDLIVVGRGPSGYTGDRRARAPVAVWFDSAGSDAEALSLAIDIALARGVALLVMAANAGVGAGTRRGELELLLAGAPATLRRTVRTTTDVASALDAVRHAGSAIVVASRRSRVVAEEFSRLYLGRPERVLVMTP
ncbi:MAG: hypothetical protein IT495_12170 [Gammaproteobacteria bacterium]|nr:hypothetical protein [Gammaproteobacteria bacterium]